MRKSCIMTWLTRLAWMVLLFDVLLIVADPISLDDELLLIAYAVWLIVSPALAATWLIVCHRTFFRTWTGWTIVILAFIFSMMIQANASLENHPRIEFFFSLLLLTSLWCTGVATAVLLWYQDASLKLMGLIPVLYVWAMVFGWQFQGNLIELYISDLNHPDQPSQLWWLNSLMCLSCWIVPLGVVSFLGHTIKLIVRELR